MNKHGGYQGKDKKMLDFSVNINPLGIPEGIREKLIAGIDELVKYPEITGISAIQKIADDLAVLPDNIILGNGAIELIYLFARSMGPGKALIVQPTFNEYERALTLYGWEVVHHILNEENNFTINPESLAAVIRSEKPQSVFLCNPNNPTGRAYSNGFIREMLEHSSPEITWFLDESFMDFSEETGSLSLVKEAKKSVFILKSLTKFYALPGLRIGYGVGVTPIIEKMESFKEPWTINALGLIAATGVYNEKDYAQKTKTYIHGERQRVFNALSQIKTLKVYPSGADFHLCRLLTGTVAELQIDLEKAGMSLRTCEDFMGLDHSYFRIAIKKEADNTKLLTFLKNWRN
ncbi:MAG: aminotransferase class I/II-fold pyridoxal phosphate-dependent enzyme [Acetobacterium sp.]|nr:aminotransferase class I/II-fold pyridoxal phosphate-dependent enzyme [Bacillota bacterium]MCG2728766.1 aminotransferase class I/II-fold pyridoxal phosphate-dependent enzyme [Acetobacterium sp.]